MESRRRSNSLYWREFQPEAHSCRSRKAPECRSVRAHQTGAPSSCFLSMILILVELLNLTFEHELGRDRDSNVNFAPRLSHARQPGRRKGPMHAAGHRRGPRPMFRPRARRRRKSSCNNSEKSMTDLVDSSVRRAGIMRYRFDEESGSLRGRLKGLSIWIGGDKHNVRLLGHSIPPKKSGSATNSHQPQPSNSGAPDVAGSSSEHPGRADNSKPKVTFKATVDVAIIENDKDGLRRDEDGNLVEGNPALREEGPLSKKSKFEFGEPGRATYKKINWRPLRTSPSGPFSDSLGPGDLHGGDRCGDRLASGTLTSAMSN